MLQEIGTFTVSMTSAAVEAVQNILAERNLDGYALYVAGSGALVHSSAWQVCGTQEFDDQVAGGKEHAVPGLDELGFYYPEVIASRRICLYTSPSG